MTTGLDQSYRDREGSAGVSVQPLVELRNVSKRFGGVRALKDVSLEVRAGEIVGLAGENGAGKSTILNVMTGVVQPDSGDLFRNGMKVHYRGLHDANNAGVYRVYQEPGLLPQLPVYENVFLGHESLFSRRGALNRPAMIAAAREHLAEIGRDDIDPRARANTLRWSERQTVEIVRAVAAAELLEVANPVILFDEPTAAMAHDELSRFLDLMRDFKSRGMTMVFVSHRLREVLDMSDRIYILKDGQMVAQTNRLQIDEHEMHALMVGRERVAHYYHEDDQLTAPDEKALELRGATLDGAFEDVTLEVRKGEILGIGGVTGSGKEELGRAVAGFRRLTAGEIWFDGERVDGTNARERIWRGIGYVPVDRNEEGVILHQSLRSNIVLGALGKICPRVPGLISRRTEHKVVNDMIRQLGIVTPDSEASIAQLSGGNAQKVVIGKTLLAGARVVVLDNPTRGVDAGAKHEIYGMLRALTANGVAILLVTEDLLELIGLSNRIAIMRDGKVTVIAEAPTDKKPGERDLVAQMV